MAAEHHLAVNEIQTLTHEQLYQIIFGGDRSQGWQSWQRNIATVTGCAEGSIGQMGKTKKKEKTHWKGGASMTRGYRQIWIPIHPKATKIGYVLEHVLRCEQALGQFLPPGAVPHHVNEIKSDNSPSNLVLCENRAYHNLIHKRARALKECGHADWLRCKFCHQWSSPDSLYTIVKNGETVSWHRSCIQLYNLKKNPGRKPRPLRGPYKTASVLAFEACGHADWVKCQHCGIYEDRVNLYVYKPKDRPERGYHTACHSDDQRKRRKARKELQP